MSHAILQDICYLGLLLLLSFPLGLYIAKVMQGQPVFLTRLLSPLETCIYKSMGIRPEEEMRAHKYVFSIVSFSLVGFLFLFCLQMLQGVLPLNPEKLDGISWHLSFNTAASFISNTNWQAYQGEWTLSYVTQAIGLTVQNFVSAAVGISVLFVVIRGFVAKQKSTVGNFWVDMTRITLYVLLPLSFVVTLLLVSQGVVQTFAPYKEIATLQDGVSQTIPLGPAASQIAIKQLGTNGGGFFGATAAFPLENPTAFSNLIELLSIMLIPAALCVSFGYAVKNSRQGRSILTTMLILFVVSLTVVTLSEYVLAPTFAGTSFAGNMEGKEVVHGVGLSALWGTATTAASNGSVNASHDSFTPLAGMMMMFLMQLGEIVFGGVGSGLYGMLAFIMLTVFIAGLMVGRTPEYLGKKIEPFDMKMVCLIILTPPLLTLIGTAAAVSMPTASSWLTNTGAHGFSEILYGYSSMANNNGSAFAGLQANTVFTNVVGGFMMLLVRFIPMFAAIFLAGNLAEKKCVAQSEGTLSTSNATFIGLLVGVILIVGALSFLPALTLGPIADFFTTR